MNPSGAMPDAPAFTAAAIFSTVASGTGFCPTTAAAPVRSGRCRAHECTRTSRPRIAGRRSSNCCAPAISQDSPSHTRTVSAAATQPVRARRNLSVGLRSAFPDDVEVVVERGDLIDLGLRQPHLLGQRRQMLGRKAAEPSWMEVQVLDQQVALARGGSQQLLDFSQRRGVDLAPSGRLAFARPSVHFRRDGNDSMLQFDS